MTIGERSVLNGFKTQVNLFFAQSSSPINKYVILPISESNSLRDKVIVIGEIALSIITLCAFSATLHLTLKTFSILGKGIGAIAGVGLLDVFSMLICDIAKRTFFKKELQETQEELLDRKLQGASKQEFCDQFFKLTGQALEDMYLPQVQNKIQQETGCDPFYKGLVPILVRFACLKGELQKKEDAMEKFFLGKNPSKNDKRLIQEIKNKRYLDVFRVKLEVALAYMIIEDPFTKLEHGLEEIGCLNEVVFSEEATQFLDTDIPYFICHEVKDRKKMRKHQYITFSQMQESNVVRLAKKLAKMQED
jgi:hypothetical protein